jgi:hypothetical protein
LLLAFAGCAYYGLDVEGKKCKLPDHPCPSGYRCVKADGDSVCKKGTAIDDGGTDGGDQVCSDGEAHCVGAGSGSIRICRDGQFVLDDCDTGKYCFEVEGEVNASCVNYCTNHEECYDGFYCDEDEPRMCKQKGNCTEFGVYKCNPQGDKVVACNEDTGFEDVIQTCEDDQYCDFADPACKDYCENDLGCSAWTGTSCNLSTGKCIPMNLCKGEADCPDPDGGGNAVCVGAPAEGACVVEPTVPTVSSGGAAVLDCFDTDPSTPPGPSTCEIEGFIEEFFSMGPIRVGDDSQDLVIQLHLLADILDGVTDNPQHTASPTAVTVGDHEEWHYQMTNVATNTSFVVDVHCDPAPSPSCKFDTLYTFELYIRADDCQAAGGTLDVSPLAIWQLNYDAFMNPPGSGVIGDDDKGLVLGRLKDCDGNRLQYGTGGLSMPHEILYYLRSGPTNLEDPHTNPPGLFAAANVTPIRGLAAALVLDVASPRSLWLRPVRAFPRKASLVVFEEPKKLRP